jgi:transcription factor IIIB subunit 2
VEDTSAIDRALENEIQTEISTILASHVSSPPIIKAVNAARHADKQAAALALAPPPPLDAEWGDQELDEHELDMYIMTEAEVQLKERVWVELNRQYLEEVAGASSYPCTGQERQPAQFCFSERGGCAGCRCAEAEETQGQEFDYPSCGRISNSSASYVI